MPFPDQFQGVEAPQTPFLTLPAMHKSMFLFIDGVSTHAKWRFNIWHACASCRLLLANARCKVLVLAKHAAGFIIGGDAINTSTYTPGHRVSVSQVAQQCWAYSHTQLAWQFAGTATVTIALFYLWQHTRPANAAPHAGSCLGAPSVHTSWRYIYPTRAMAIEHHTHSPFCQISRAQQHCYAMVYQYHAWHAGLFILFSTGMHQGPATSCAL
jgi:hypothetical protein